MEKVNLLQIREVFPMFPLKLQLKWDLKYKVHVYFETVPPYIIYGAFNCQKSHNKFYEDVSIAKCLSSEEMFRFSDILEVEWENESDTEKVISGGKEMSQIINADNIKTETEHASVEDPLIMYITASNQTTLVSNIPSIFNKDYN